MEQEGWDIEATLRLVLKLSGKHHYQTARLSIQSIWRRLEYARIHYLPAVQSGDAYIAENLEEQFMIAVLYKTDESWEEFNELIYRIGAQIIASAQDVHTVADILGFALYYSLGLDKTKKIDDSRISAKRVKELLDASAELSEVAALYNDLLEGGDFPHLSALVNYSKHRSLVRVALNENHDGTQSQRHALTFESFSYSKDEQYPSVEVKQFLQREIDRCWKLGVNIGKALHKVLEARLAAQPPKPTGSPPPNEAS
jgi:hypothetical protein